MIPPFVFILGMHRCGTSCLAGSLETCGLFLGDVRRTGVHNAKGYFENAELVKCHDQILALNRAAWHEPPAGVEVHPYHLDLLKGIVAELGRNRPCGVKDPRLLLLLDHWLDIAPPPHAMVGTFRHPAAAAASLARRNKMNSSKALDLWRQYNARLIEEHQRHPFPLVEYRLDDARRYCASVAVAAEMLGLSPNMKVIRKFVEARLEHHKSLPGALPRECRDAYDYLQENKIKPADYPRARRHWVENAKKPLEKAHRAVLRLTARNLAARVGKSGQLRGCLLFVGNARSGATLVKSLLDAHPALVLGHEVDIAGRMMDGWTWYRALRAIMASSMIFKSKPSWNGYDYSLKIKGRPDSSDILIVGDKKANVTTTRLLENREMLPLLIKWIPLPILFLHCVRNPLDVIVTKTRKNKRTMRENIDGYLACEQLVGRLRQTVGSGRCLTIYQEQLIRNPVEVLRMVFGFLELDVDEDYLETCRALVFKKTHLTRQDAAWSREHLTLIREGVSKIPHLACYADEIDEWINNRYPQNTPGTFDVKSI